MFSSLLSLTEAGTVFLFIFLFLLVVLFIAWVSGALGKIKDFFYEVRMESKQEKKEQEEKEIQEKEEQRKKAIIEEKNRRLQRWVTEGHTFRNIDISKVCKNFIDKIGEDKFYCPDLIILQTILLTCPPLINLYPNLELHRYYKEDKIIIQTLKNTVFEKEQLQDTEENLIRCYSTIKRIVLSILAEKVKNEFGLTGIDSLTEFLSNDCIVHDDSTNIFKLSIYEKVNRSSDSSLIDIFGIAKEKLNNKIQTIHEEEIKNSLLLENNNDNKIIHNNSLEDTDFMSAIEFEQFLGESFKSLGYKVEYTKASGDQGIDLIITKNNQKTGVQAKCYSQKVSNSAVQEAVAGKSYYHLDRVIVITNNYFTQGAKELAASNNVILWDRDVLKEKFFQ